MADVFINAQTVVVAATDTTLYTVPLTTEAVLKITATNIGGTARTFRIAVRRNGAAIANQMYLVFDASIVAQGTYERAGITLTATGGQDIIMVRADHADVVFACYGVEV